MTLDPFKVVEPQPYGPYDLPIRLNSFTISNSYLK